MQTNLQWHTHVTATLAKGRQLLGLLKRLKESNLSISALSKIYELYIRPRLEYASVAWSNLTQGQADQLERFQRKAAKVILGYPLSSHVDHSFLLSCLQWHTLSSRRHVQLVLLAHKLYHKTAPSHLLAVTPPLYHPHTRIRHARVFIIPPARTDAHLQSPILKSCHLFNCLPDHIRKIPSYNEFRRQASSLILTSKCHCSSHIRT